MKMTFRGDDIVLEPEDEIEVGWVREEIVKRVLNKWGSTTRITTWKYGFKIEGEAKKC